MFLKVLLFIFGFVYLPDRVTSQGSSSNSSAATYFVQTIVRDLYQTKTILRGLLRAVLLEVGERHNDSTILHGRIDALERKMHKAENMTKEEIREQKNTILSELNDLRLHVDHIFRNTSVNPSVTPRQPNAHIQHPRLPPDCASLYISGVNESGVYTLQIDQTDNGTIVDAYCDMDTDGGGWTLIQRRVDGTDDFFRGWESYKNGFGEVNHDFWLGLKYTHLLTKNGNNRMRIDLWDWENRTRHAEFDFVTVNDEKDNFRILAGGYHGNAGDPFNHNDYERRMQSMQFSTFDKDNDMNARASCAKAFTSGWWFNNCFQVNLNGVWYPSGSYYSSVANGIVWDLWTDHKRGYSLRKTEIKFRPESF